MGLSSEHFGTLPSASAKKVVLLVGRIKRQPLPFPSAFPNFSVTKVYIQPLFGTNRLRALNFSGFCFEQYVSTDYAKDGVPGEV